MGVWIKFAWKCLAECSRKFSSVEHFIININSHACGNYLSILYIRCLSTRSVCHMGNNIFTRAWASWTIQTTVQILYMLLFDSIIFIFSISQYWDKFQCINLCQWKSKEWNKAMIWWSNIYRHIQFNWEIVIIFII